LKITSPFVGLTFPVITSRNVVLPAPLGPITALNSPFFKFKLSLLRAKKPSKLTVIFRNI